MNPHMDWFCEYEKYNGGDVLLGDDLTTKITWHGRVKLFLTDGRITTFHRDFHILELARKLISISKMSGVGVHTLFENEACKTVQGKIMLMREVHNGTMSKILGSTITDGCNSSIVPKGGNEEGIIHTVSGEKKILWNQILGYIG